MAHVVYITNGLASTLNSGFEMCRRLLDVGHEVTWLSDESTAERIRQRGFAARALVTDRRLQRQVVEDGRRLSRRHPLQLLQWLRIRRKLRLDSLGNEEITETLTDLRPDLLLIDHEMHFAIIASAKLNIPTLLPSVFFTMYHHVDLPPLHTPLLPGQGADEQRKIDVAWSCLFRERRWQHFRERFSLQAVRSMFRPVAFKSVRRADLAAVAHRHGYRLSSETSTRQWVRPHAYMNLPILCYNVLEMELPHQPRANMHYVGPMIDRQRGDGAAHPESGRLWGRFLEDRQKRPQPLPLVYCSLGTFWSADHDLLSAVIGVFRKRIDWQLVVGLGGMSHRERFGEVPDNVLLLDYAPQLDVLPHCDVAITHGGATSLNECVALGVPMLVYSTSHVDQDGNAVRVQVHGLGIRAHRESASESDIESNLDRLMCDAVIKDNISRMRTVIDEYRAEQRAERVIEEMLQAAK